MIKKKAIIITFVTLSLCLLLTGCHGSKGISEFVVPETLNMNKEYNITFWAKNDSNAYQANVYRKAIKDFEALYPNIHIQMKTYNDYTKIYNDVITNISTNTTPNICITYPDHIATYLTGNSIVVNLNDLIDDEKYGFGGSEIKFDGPKKDEVIKKFLDECYLNDGYYAIPYMRSTEACYINKDFVEKLGYTLPEQLTWDFIWEVSQKAVEKDSDGNYLVNGQKTMIPFIYKSTDNMMIQYLKQANIDFSNSNGEIFLFNNDTKNFLFDINKYASEGAFSTFKIVSYPGNFLNAGQCIFAIDSTAGATWMGTDAPNLDISEDQLHPFEMVVTEIPQLDPNNPQMISQGPSICLFNKEDNEEVLASWLFAQFLLTNEVQITYSETEGYLPVTTKAIDSDEYQQYLSKGDLSEEYYWPKIEASKIVARNIDNTFVTAVFNGSTSLRNAAGQLIEDVTTAPVRGYVVDDDYMTTEYYHIYTLYRLNQINTTTIGKQEFGPLDNTAKGLLISIAVIWVGIGGFWLKNQLAGRKKKEEKN